MTPETLAALALAGRRVRKATEERNRLIYKAVRQEGGSLRTVGMVVGLSHTAVKFIAYGRDSVATPDRS